MRIVYALTVVLLFAGLFNGDLHAQSKPMLRNPLLPSGADPWCIYKDGFYYYTNTTGDNITIWKTRQISQLRSTTPIVAFTPPSSGPCSRELWAPEIHYIQKKWYIYFAADSGRNEDHRLWVLENASADPTKGKWILKGKLETPEDKWSIDGSVFEANGKLYLIWSGWEGDTNGQQNIYIAAMSNPWTVTGRRVLLSKPELDWETHGDLNNPNDVPHVNVNEGPQILEHGKKRFLIYSASGCWTDYYALGMLSADINSDPMDPASWTKSAKPVFKQSPANGVYAPGHNSFFTSPDGKEDWILYHANDKPGQGCGKWRSPRAQPFSWNADGTPDFGEPVSTDTPLPAPGSSR